MKQQDALLELKKKSFVSTFEKQKVVDVAVEALEKQIPKKPIINPINEIEVDWKCPVCGLNVIEELPASNYCQRCGQKLDWSEEKWQM